MPATELQGSGGWINADITDEQVEKSKLVPNMLSLKSLWT